MEKIKKYILPALILLLIMSLIVFFRSWLMTYIVEPIAVLLWVMWRILSSVEQSVYWIALIVVCALIISRLISLRQGSTPDSSYDYTYQAPNRVEHWQGLIANAPLGKQENKYLRDSLRKLHIALSEQIEHSDTTGPKQGSVKDKAPLSAQARRFLYLPTGKDEWSPVSLRRTIAGFIPRWLRKRTRANYHQEYILIDEILMWMEIELEINELETSYGD